MRKIESVEELKKIQLDILLSLHQFCSENNINYSLAAGSLIGAVRHKGFIPWDDDIDVYLLRSDYKKLEKSFPQFYDEKYSFVTINRDSKWPRVYGKMYDSRTVEDEDATNKYPIGIGIDIFPVDDVPDDINEWRSFEKKRRFWRDFTTLKSMTFSKNRSMSKNLFMIVSRCLTCFFSFSYLTRKMDRLSQMHNGKGYKHVYENCPGVYNSKRPWLKIDLYEFLEVPFEGHQIRIMKGYDDYLTTVYGNYMQLPPIEKRVSTHTIKAFWK